MARRSKGKTRSILKKEHSSPGTIAWRVIRASDTVAGRLLLLPFGGGTEFAYDSTLPFLNPSLEVYCAKLPGRPHFQKMCPFNSMTEIAAFLVDYLPEDEVPTVLFGHSFGALLGYEFALLMSQSRRNSIRKFIASCGQPPTQTSTTAGHKKPISSLGDAEFIAAILAYGGISEADLAEEAVREFVVAVLRHDFRLLESYVNQHGRQIDVPLQVVIARNDSSVELAVGLEWQRFV